MYTERFVLHKTLFVPKFLKILCLHDFNSLQILDFGKIFQLLILKMMQNVLVFEIMSVLRSGSKIYG